jgi:ribosomal protein S15P/S13E
MKNLKSILGIMLIATLTFTVTSCRDSKKEEAHDDMEMKHDDMKMDDSSMNSSDNMGMDQNKSASDAIIVNYLELKNALVTDNTEAAASFGQKLVSDFEAFEVKNYSKEEQKELKEIIEDAKEHAEHIAESALDHQREHFEILSKDVVDLLAITGTNKTLFQDFCPMYNDGKGAIWISEIKEIKNPYYGSKMLTCGSMQKEI